MGSLALRLTGAAIALVGATTTLGILAPLAEFSDDLGLHPWIGIGLIVLGIGLMGRSASKDWDAAGKALGMTPAAQPPERVFRGTTAWEAPVEGGTKYLHTLRYVADGNEPLVVMGIRPDRRHRLRLRIRPPGLKRAPPRGPMGAPGGRIDTKPQPYPGHEFKVAGDEEGRALLAPFASRLDELRGYVQLYILEDRVEFELGNTLPDLETVKKQMFLLEELHAELSP